MAKSNQKTEYRKENGRFDIYAMVNDLIIEQLANGIIPWQRPWTGVRGGVYSRVTGRSYSLINQMLLIQSGEYLTYKQLTEEGGKLKKDAKSRILVFWKQIEHEKTGDNGEHKVESFPILRYYRVYHIDQCEGITRKWKPEELPDFKPIQSGDAIASTYFAQSGCGIERNRQNRACYSPSLDRISMPLQEQFPDSAEYYGTLFHEIAHSTGHPKRLARCQMDSQFGSEPYGREELVTELTAASLLNMADIATRQTEKNNVAYLQSWLRAIKADNKMLFWAASRTDKALNYILDEEEVPNPVNDQKDEPALPEDISVTEPESIPIPVASIESPPRKAPTAIRKFAMDCQKIHSSTRPNIAGAYILGDRQYITDNHMAVSIEVPYPDLPSINDDLMGFDATKLFESARKGNSVMLPPYHTIKEQYKAAKGKKRNYLQFTDIGGIYLSTQKLIRAMELVGFKQGSALVTNAASPIYLNGKGVELILLPCRVSGSTSSNIWRYNVEAA